MTAGGWTFMLVSIAFVLGLVIYCFAKILRGHGERGKAGRGPGRPGPGA